MDWINIVALVIPLAISSSSLLLVFIWRKKDFQLAIFKDQMSAYHDLLENLFETSQEINYAYNEKMSKLVLEKGLDYTEEEFATNQSEVFIEFSKKYKTSFNRFQRRIFLLPEDVIDATMEYYNYLSQLFESNMIQNWG